MIFINIKGYVSLFDGKKTKGNILFDIKLSLLIDVSCLLLIRRLMIKNKLLIKRVTRLAINK
jgi:hypothetical protein